MIVNVLHFLVCSYLCWLLWKSRKALRDQLDLILDQRKTVKEQLEAMELARTVIEQWKERALFAEAQLMVARDVLQRHGFVMTAVRVDELSEQKDKN